MTGPLADQFVVNVRAIRDPYVNQFEIEYVLIPLLDRNKESLKLNRTAITIVETEDKRMIEPVTVAPSMTPAQHIFACHCGKVQAEMLTPIQGQEVKEDNCSSCVRVSLIGSRV